MRIARILRIHLMLILLCGLGVALPAQQDWSWVLGDSVLMQFPGGGAPFVDPIARTRYQLENGASIGDQTGNLLLYANKDSVFSASGIPVFGGRLFSWGDITNGTTILPVIGDASTYHVFYITAGLCAGVTCPRMARVKVHPVRDSIVTHFNLGQYDPLNLISEKLSAVKDAGGTGWWVFYHGTNDNKFIRFHVEGTQVSSLVTQSIGEVHGPVGINPGYSIGEMCFSPQGDKLLAVTVTGVIDVFDFDRCTGELSNWVPLGTPAPGAPGPDTYYGCSFSPDGTKIYVSEENNNQNWNTHLFQWDLLASNIAASKTIIDTTRKPMEFGQHQLGPDGKIYIANLAYPLDSTNPNNYYLSVINNPNQAGTACNFVYNGLWLEGRQSTLHLPNLPNFNLAPLVAQNAQAGPPQVVLCPGDSVQLGSPDTTGGAVTYAWTAHPDISDTTLPQQWVAPSQSSWFYLTVTDSAVGIPCGVTRDSVWVVVADSSYFPEVMLRDTTICAGDSLRLSLEDSSAGIGWTYLWSTGSDSASTVVSAAGLYSVTVTNTVGTGACFVASASVRVDTFGLLLVPGFAGMDSTICEGDSLVLGTPLPSQWVGSWSPLGGLLDPDSLVTVAMPTVTTAYVLAATDTSNHGSCATVRDTVVAKVEQKFTHNMPASQEFCPGEILTVGVEGVSGYSYIWSPLTGLQNPFISSTTVAPLTPIVYTLAVTSDTMVSENCKTQYFPVALSSEGCMVQNVVTPNGDGVNDFLVLGTFNGPISLSIFDRWGALVYSSSGYRGDWPSSDGATLPESVYYYVVKVAGEGGKSFVGEVMVLR